MTQLNVLNDEEPFSGLDIDARLRLSAAIDTYLRSERQYNEAAQRFNESCNQLRQCIKPNMRYVLRRDWQNYLLTTDAGGDFEIEEIDSL